MKRYYKRKCKGGSIFVTDRIDEEGYWIHPKPTVAEYYGSRWVQRALDENFIELTEKEAFLHLL